MQLSSLGNLEKRPIPVNNESQKENSPFTGEKVKCANLNDISAVTHFEPSQDV